LFLKSVFIITLPFFNTQAAELQDIAQEQTQEIAALSARLREARADGEGLRVSFSRFHQPHHVIYIWSAIQRQVLYILCIFTPYFLR
jgi:hypothetical protein